MSWHRAGVLLLGAQSCLPVPGVPAVGGIGSVLLSMARMGWKLCHVFRLYTVVMAGSITVTTGNNPTGVPDVRALILVPGGKTEPQTKPYPLDMWKYGSALQQRPEDRSLYGRGATIKTMHPEPSPKPFWGF
uniref:Polyprotein n=2 Tax=Oryza sativa subsp. japonica TaxID=39947 RepID=A0A5S6RAP1_ORYSJ|nr:Putative polyprotein [Oryza sativa Japonica Group]ABB46769.2 transposon protein, putative, unclassified [Oryza sativa Japonica Group]